MLQELLANYNPKDPRQVEIRNAFKSLPYAKKIKTLPVYKSVLDSSLAEQCEWLRALMVGLRKLEDETDRRETWHARSELTDLIESLLKRKLPFTKEDILLVEEWSRGLTFYNANGAAAIIKAAETYFKAHPDAADAEVVAAMRTIAKRLNDRSDADSQRYGSKLDSLLHEVSGEPGQPRQVPSLLMDDEDAWATFAKQEIAALAPEIANDWNTLLTTCAQAKASSPAAKWLTQARAEREKVGWPAFRAALLRWFPLVDTPRVVDEEDVARLHASYQNQYREGKRWEMAAIHGDMLKGILWLCADQDDAEIARAVSKLVKDSFRKIPGHGARLARVGNAGMWALGQMPGMHGAAQLAILKTRLKLPIIQKQIAAAFDETAKRLNLSASEIEELVVPTYGLGENGQPVGVRVEEFNEYRAEIRFEDGEPVLRWYKSGAEKPLASAPAAVKSVYPDEVKDLTQTVKDLRGMLTAQKERIDNLFLAQKSWDFASWRERYLDHPLVGLVARRLIWKFSRGEQAASGIWLNDQLVDLNDQPLPWLDDVTKVELWHPLNAHLDVVLGWRRWFETHQVQQPFKQAHREIYILTDAERNTVNYSNRYAAHIIRQHQFSALCAARGWKHQLRLMVDASYPAPFRNLENWGLRAEYWVESVGDNYGEDTNDSGTYLYLATDQVRFYAVHAPQSYAHSYGGGYDQWRGTDTPLPVDQIPPLVFSEIMRDVDLFVGVASVGNDPNWFDGGPGGRHITYWQGYSFGALTESAKTRRSVLEIMLPRLKIADRCRLEERFLVVRGDLRTYKIHLGSGNILMEPNDQYLCIVPKSAASAGKERVFLPFEGDQTLSIIISKAFLLADDKSIKDPTITRQLGK